MKRTWSAILGLAFWISFSGVIAWPAISADAEPPCDGNAIASPREISVTLDRGGTFALPGGWHWTQSPAGEHFVLGMAASTNPCAVDDMVTVTPKRLSVERLRRTVLQPEDAFVLVAATYMASIEPEDLPRLPAVIHLEDLQRGDELWGEPVYETAAGSVDWYAQYVVGYWIGPEAAPEDRAGAERALASLRLR